MGVRIKNLGKTVLFVAIGCVILYLVSRLFGVSNEYSEHAEMIVNGYYEQEENSIDALFIGNSHVYRYWQPAFAWEQHGLASMEWSTSDLPYGAMKNVVIEALKTQSPKVLVLDASVFANGKDGPSNKIYLLLDNMKYSANYFDMIRNFCEFSDVEGMEKLQYYFPMIQFHSRWTELTELDFRQTMPSYLNSCYQENFLAKTIQPVEHIVTDKRVAIAPRSEDALRDLLGWCQKQDVEILFYIAPMLRKEKQTARFNYIGDIIKEYGQEFVNFNDGDLYGMFGFVESEDFQDRNHTNIKGSYKFTNVFGEYLKERYGLSDRSGGAPYADWDAQASAYYAIVGPYLNAKTE